MNELQELTGYESGVTSYKDGEVIVCSWAHVSGVPRLSPIGTCMIGLGDTEHIDNAVALPVSDLTDDMQDAADADMADCGEPGPAKCVGLWRLGDETLVAVFDGWH